jgi:predicted DNA-binding transcriptional regulator AlpA
MAAKELTEPGIQDMEVAAPKQSRKMQPQPVEMVNIPGVWLNVRTVELVVGFKKTKINEEIKAGRFPPPDHVSVCMTRWLSDHIKDYNLCRAKGVPWSIERVRLQPE